MTSKARNARLALVRWVSFLIASAVTEEALHISKGRASSLMTNPDRTGELLIVAAALIARGREILIAQRPAGSPHAGMWEFPGGKVEAGEDPRAALVRECREELGIGVRAGSIYETVYTKLGRRGILLLFYTTEIVEGVPQSLERNAFEWKTPEEMVESKLLPADRPLIAEFRRRFPTFQPGFQQGGQ